jgi:hypothetical protein
LQVRGGHPDEYLLYPKSDRLRPLTPSGLHRWFKRCLERAGASDLWRRTGNLVLAQQLFRHEAIETTRRYLHPSHEDLIAGMRVADDEEAKP